MFSRLVNSLVYIYYTEIRQSKSHIWLRGNSWPISAFFKGLLPLGPFHGHWFSWSKSYNIKGPNIVAKTIHTHMYTYRESPITLSRAQRKHQ